MSCSRIFNSKKNVISPLYSIFLQIISSKINNLFSTIMHYSCLRFSAVPYRESFSRTKNAKSKNRSTISHQHVKNCLRIAPATSIYPNIDLILSKKRQFRTSHLLLFNFSIFFFYLQANDFSLLFNYNKRYEWINNERNKLKIPLLTNYYSLLYNCINEEYGRTYRPLTKSTTRNPERF